MEIFYISLLVLAFQRTIFKNHLLSLMSQMEEFKASSLMFEEYDVACSIQKKIESIKKDLKDYEA